MKIKHSLEVRKRAFAIWQKLGRNPWERPHKAKKKKGKSRDFYRGAFDSIPFLNDDAKRTFRHLLLRPGYMIRDYIQGEHERYLAPLTALIVFYAFFALLSSVLQPVQEKKSGHRYLDIDMSQVDSTGMSRTEHVLSNTAHIISKGYLYLHLDQYPDQVKTQHQASLAAFEGTLRSQGIPLFISQFFFLWFAMYLALRRHRQSFPACAAASAYILCQFSFFMLFALIFTLGKSKSIGLFLMFLLLTWDYCQWLGIGIRKSMKRAIVTGVYYVAIYGMSLVMIGGIALFVAYLKS